MFDDDSVKVGVLATIAFLGFVFLIAGGLTLDSYFHKQSVSECIQADKIWSENSCVNNINELRYIDK